ncbi:unnamed protein product [Withania somnifera]
MSLHSVKSYSRVIKCFYSSLPWEYREQKAFLKQSLCLISIGIAKDNVVIWSIMVHGYSKNGLHKKSVECFTSMRNTGLVPNSFTIVGVLVGVSGLRDLILGQLVHGLVMKLGWEDNSFMGTSLLEVYAKCGSITASCKIFEDIKKSRFRKSALFPNSMTVMALIQSCVNVGSKCLYESVHALVGKFELVFDVQVSNSLLFLYSSLMESHAAWEIFNTMEEKDVISWSTMMSLLVHLEYASAAIKLFLHMRYSVNEYDHLISACGILGNLKMGKSNHAQVTPHGFGSELPLLNAMITMYARCEDLNSSRTVFDHAIMKSMAPDMFIRVTIEEKFSMDTVLLVSALTTADEMVASELCMQLHCHTIETGLTKYRSIQNCLISTYSKLASIRDIVSWNVIINGYGINGHGETALSLFHKFRESGGTPDSATYLSILSACSHSGLASDGLLIFNQIIEDNRIRVGAEHYGCVADLLARAGYLPDTILHVCARNSDLKLAEFSARKFHEQIKNDPGQLVLLSNLYASVGRFKDP